MEQILDTTINFLASKGYGSIVTILLIAIAIYGIYIKIKYNALEKASTYVAEVEKRTDLTGEQKFALCKLWLANEMKITKSAFMNKIVEKLIQYAYDNSKEYALNYIARKTNIDVDQVSNVLTEIKNQVNDLEK